MYKGNIEEITFFYLQFARQFYLSQWLRDTHLEMNKSMKDSSAPNTNTTMVEDEESAMECNAVVEKIQVLEERKKYLYGLVDESHTHRSIR